MEKDYKKLYEETKKLYDDTLEKAKEINDEHKDSILGKTIEYLFPQLKDNEDEKMRKWLIGYFEQYKIDGMGDFANGYKVDDIVAWIEKKGGKPVEWTEEDESKLREIRYALYDCYTEGNAEELMDWIKSLKERVQLQDKWKPSEEQMKALDTTLRHFSTSSISKDPGLLETLYNDLKKL